MFRVFQTIPISFRKSSVSMEVTSLTQIFLRTEVHKQSRQDVWGIYLVIDRKSKIFPKELKLNKGKVLPFYYFLLITSDGKPPGSDPAGYNLPVLKGPHLELIVQAMLRNEKYMVQQMVVAEGQPAENFPMET